MKTLTQKIIQDDGTEYEITHIFAESGHFVEKTKKKKDRSDVGWHIQLGTEDSADNYTEVQDENELHDVPDSLPDLYIHVKTEKELEIEIIENGIEYPDGKESPWA